MDIFAWFLNNIAQQPKNVLDMRLKALFERRRLWTIAIYRLGTERKLFDLDTETPVCLLCETALRTSRDYQGVRADPFLIEYDHRLYLFYEIQTDFGVGEIWAKSMDSSGRWKDHGSVLKESFHLSYPQVFSIGGRFYMIPEAAQSGRVLLYSANSLPGNWKMERVLIDESLLDTSIILRDEGVFLLGTTREYECILYWAPTLADKFIAADYIIACGKGVARNAGRPILIDGRLYRFSQNCENQYGQNISVHLINNISLSMYSETMILPDLFPTKQPWMQLGSHHVSAARFDGDYYVAIDGMSQDRYVNTLALGFLKGVDLIRRVFV